MEAYFSPPRERVREESSRRRSFAAERSKRSYDNNKIKVARRRILNAIRKGRCVLERTMRDPKYRWTDAETAMLKRCLALRRGQYAMNPEDITIVRDKRYQRQAREVDVLQSVKRKLEEKLGAVDTLEGDNHSENVEDLFEWLNQEIGRREVRTIVPVLSAVNNEPPPFSSPPSPPLPSSPPRRQSNRQPSPRSSARRSSPPSPPSLSQARDVALMDDQSVISKQDVIDAYEYMIQSNIIYDNRSMYSKQKGKQEYIRSIDRLFEALGAHSFPTSNLLDVYRRPMRYKSVTQNNKKWLQILFKLHNSSCNHLYSTRRVASGIVNLCYTVESIATYMDQFQILRNRDAKAEENRQKNAPFYDWNDIMRIPPLIKGNSIQANRDRIIMRLYIVENVVRDNFGMLRIVDKRVLDDRAHRIDYNLIYKDPRTNGYVIRLYDYKNVRHRGGFKIRLHDETNQLIDLYLGQMRDKLRPSGVELRYLITKNNGEMYQDGKLSRYIIDMFKRYTGAKNLGINELRHSVATYYKNQPQEFKARLAGKMQHSLTQHEKYERYSNKVIKLPVFHGSDSGAEVAEDPFVGRTIKILNGRTVHSGTIRKSTNDESTKEYKVVFDDPDMAPRYYTSTDIALRLETDDISLNIGKRVCYKIPRNDESVYGQSGYLFGTVAFNDEHLNDVEAPPYRLEYDDITITLPRTFRLPHPDVEFV